MAVADQVAEPVSPNPFLPVRVGFSGRIGDYWRLMLRGAALQIITLGIYRFWLYTDMRRFLWAGIRVAGETPEYSGTAAELLIGFLIALGILIPIYAVLSVGAIESGFVTPEEFSVIAFVVLAGFGQYAAYRARRYRLTRTVFRGLRFHQTGSAAGYAVRAMLWWIAAVLTLGLAWPWATANLERYKMRNTFYGHLGGSFASSGMQLFNQGVMIWLLTAAPVAAGLVAGVVLIDWTAIAEIMTNPRTTDFATFVTLVALEASDSTALGIELAVAGVTASVLAGALLYPVYDAIAMRWWLGGVRFGTAAIASDLRIGRYYGVYARYVLYALVFTIGFLAIVFGLAWIAGRMLDVPPGQIEAEFGDSTLLGGVAITAVIAAYVIYLLGVSTIYHVALKLRLWRAAVGSTLITGYAALDHVRADEAQSTAIGEGLADALGGGGI